MNKILIGVAAASALILGGLVFLVMNVNSVIKNGIELTGSAIFKVPVTVERVEVSFLSGVGEITDLKVGNPEGYQSESALQIDSLKIEIDVGSLTSNKIHIKSLMVDSPRITYEGSFTTSNLKQLQTNAERSRKSDGGSTEGSGGDGPTAGDTGDGGASSSGPYIQLDLLVISNANIEVLLSFLGDESLILTMPEMELHDLGREDELSAAGLMSEILVSLNGELRPLIRSYAAKSLGDQLKGDTVAFKDAVRETVSKLKGLFGKKKH